jgi:hypothetical protein
MCCFSGRVAHVGGTNIFARRMGARQALVYSMNVELDDAVAMVLPLPVARAAEDALAFVDLSEYPTLFRDLAAAFPEPEGQMFGLAAARGGPAPKLRVHDVGDFIASFAPAPADLDRLDERFRISPELFAARPAYRDWGFAVFQLKPRAARGWWPWRRKQAGGAQTVHPMAFTFESREPDALFYPTVHVHDGTVPAHAAFDHTLYAQVGDDALGRTLAWEASALPTERVAKIARTAGLVDGALPLRRQRYHTRLRNVDLWLRPPASARPLAAAGEAWRWRVHAPSAHGREMHEETASALVTNMRTRLDALHDAIADGVPPLIRANAAAWKLAPLDSAPEYYRFLLTREGLVDRLQTDAGKAARCRLTVNAQTEGLDAQPFELAFTHVPSGARLAEIAGELGAVIRRAVAAPAG